MIGVKQIGGGGSSQSQDNIDIVKYFSTGTISTSRMVDTVSEILAFMPELEIGETQSLWFNFLFSDAVTVRYKMIKKGKGIYGVGATPINFSDLHFISSTGTTVADLEENPTTEKYYIEDLGGQTISEFVNAKFLGYEIKDKELGETIFKVGIEPNFVTYWFVGDSGTYGEGLLQSVDSDFELLSEDREDITKVSQLENDSNFIDSVSVQNGNGFEQFRSNELKFEGFSFDHANKKIRADALIPLSAFLDVVNGSDINGVIQNSNRPYKTIDALLEALPTTTGETFTIYITGNTVNFNKPVVIRNLNFVSYTGSTFDFSDMVDDAGYPVKSVFVGDNHYSWTFQGNNISIVSNYNGVRLFGMVEGYLGLDLKGTINNFKWVSLPIINYLGSVVLGRDTDLVIRNLRNENYAPNNQSSLFTAYNVPLGRIKLRINNLLHSKESFPLFRYINLDVRFDNITAVDLAAVKNLNIIGAASESNLSVGDVNINGIFDARGITNLFTNSKFSITTNVQFSGSYNNGAYTTIEGTIISDQELGGGSAFNNILFKRFNGRLGNGTLNDSPVTFQDCNIITQNYLLYREAGGGLIDAIIFKGFNSITQNNTDENLFRDYAYGNIGINSPTGLVIYGELKTNASSYGFRITSKNPNASFKEKLKEVVIRSKLDLVNRVLDSNMNYVIDGVISNFLSTDRIIVPVGGLSLSGYGFDVSSLKALQPNSLLFSSPVGGSGNLFLSNISLEASGGNSKVFGVTNAGAATGGADAIELNVVNFDNCDSLGNITNFRQGLWDNIGIFGCKDGLTFNGVMSGGFRAESVIVRNFGIAGTASTIFKKGNDLLFKSRLLTDINADFKEAGSLSDFGVVNFGAPKLYQVKAAQITRNGVLDDTQNYTGEITAFSNVSDWSGNNGLPNSKEHPYGIKTDRMKVCADDSEASENDIEIGEVYVHSATGYFKTRLI